MKRIYLLFIAILFVAQTQAQIDTQESAITIEVEDNEDSNTTIPIPKLDTPNPNAGLSTTNENTVNGLSVTKREFDFNTKKEFSMVYKSDLINPGTIFEKKWAKEKKDEALKPQYMGNQHLGDFKSNGKFLTISCRDHQYPDGDMVRVYVNDDIVKPRIILTTTYTSFLLNLEPGINKIDFQALNQGDSGPNTAE
jgi:hypothetical protein